MPSNVLSPGGVLAGGQSLRSANGRYVLVAQGDDNAVVYADGGRALWKSHTAGNPRARLVMQGDGNAVVYTPGGRALWNSQTGGNAAARLVMQDDGNLVIYRSNGTPAWFTGVDRGTAAPAPAPANPGNSKNCTDFATWREAQGWFERYYPYYGDVARLDLDGDRIARENLPGSAA